MSKQSELDEILNRLHQQYEMEFGMHKKPIDMTKVKQAILDWHNKEVEEAYKRGYINAGIEELTNGKA